MTINSIYTSRLIVLLIKQLLQITKIVGALVIVILFSNVVFAQAPQAAQMQSAIPKKLDGLYSSVKINNLSPVVKSTAVHLPKGFPTQGKEYHEVPQKRTIYSRTFTDGHSGVIVQQSAVHLNYFDKQGLLQPVNTKLSAQSSSNVISKNNWAAREQEFPTYLYGDGSTALSTDTDNLIRFNVNCKINNKAIDVADFTVGEDGMRINNAVEGITKTIVFHENAFETDYIITHPIDLNNQDLIITEEIELPAASVIEPLFVDENAVVNDSANLLNPSINASLINSPSPEERGLRGEVFVVYSTNRKEQARFRAPIFYDANKQALKGEYILMRETNKIILKLQVPNHWLNVPNRMYPVTIDPLVTGPISNYPTNFVNSCASPAYAMDSMLVTIPAGITIASLIVEDSYFADALSTPQALMTHGTMLLASHCGAVTFSCQGSVADSSGYCYLNPNTDVKDNLACCFAPSCTAQIFYLIHGLTRDAYGTGCNQNYIYYSPFSQWPFSAFITGNTVETGQTEWSVFPTTICSDSCTISLKVTTQYGVPPYTITHPWAASADQYGTATDGCTTFGKDTIQLSIPSCPATCGTSSSLTIPPPLIVDACGDTVTGLVSKTITFKPVPIATASVQEVCTGANIDIPLSACVTGSTFQWLGSDGSSGTGNISDVAPSNVISPLSLSYAVIPTAGGCVGDTLAISLQVDPLPILTVSAGDTIDPGIAVPFTVSGALTYAWTPTTALSCVDCPTPIATPVVSTNYIIAGTNEYGCISYDTIGITVNQGTEVLYIPNSFSPNSNELNDKFFLYGTSIKKVSFKIFDRWGELLFETTDYTKGWDGKYHNKDVEPGVYVYHVVCEFMSGAHTQRNGTITIFR